MALASVDAVIGRLAIASVARPATRWVRHISLPYICSCMWEREVCNQSAPDEYSAKGDVLRGYEGVTGIHVGNFVDSWHDRTHTHTLFYSSSIWKGLSPV